MQKYQFIQFAPGINAQEDCETFVPVDDNYPTTFYVNDPGHKTQDYIEQVDLVTPDGTILQEKITSKTEVYTIDGLIASETIRAHTLNKLRDILSPGQCFRLRLTEIKDTEVLSGTTETEIKYSYLNEEKYMEVLTIGNYKQNPIIPKGKWKLKVKNVYLAASIKDIGRLQIPAYVAVIKKNSISFNEGSGEIIASKYVPTGEDVEFELDIRVPTPIQIGITTAGSHQFQEKAGQLKYGEISYTGEDLIGYSNILQFVENEGEYSHIKYSCNEDGAFGFSFGRYAPTRNAEIAPLQNLLPIKVSKAQYGQTDKIYEKTNGEKVVLFANVTKEYNGETDYISEELHEKITIALCCDNVFINGERLTKSDKYEIDWDNTTETECGKKLARATFKMKANITSRNTNC